MPKCGRKARVWTSSLQIPHWIDQQLTDTELAELHRRLWVILPSICKPGKRSEANCLGMSDNSGGLPVIAPACDTN
jgi:hypothetical protein